LLRALLLCGVKCRLRHDLVELDVDSLIDRLGLRVEELVGLVEDLVGCLH
jgi:hypothetical protein